MGRKIKIDTHGSITSELEIFGVILSMSSNSLYKVVNSYLVEIIVICLWGGYKKWYVLILWSSMFQFGIQYFRNSIILKLNKNCILKPPRKFTSEKCIKRHCSSEDKEAHVESTTIYLK